MTDNGLPAPDRNAASQQLVRRLPGLVGIFLAFSFCLHLAAIVYFAFGDILPAATCFLCGQFLFGLSLLRLIDGAFVFQDIRLFFLIFTFLYGGTLPLVAVAGGGRGAGGVAGLAGAAFMYGTAILGFNFVQWWFGTRWLDVPSEAFARFRPSLANAAVVFLGFAWTIYYAVSRGITFSLGVDRGRSLLLGTQLWIVSNLVMNGLVMYMLIGWPQLTRRVRTIVILVVVAYVAVQISLGNRRDFLAMFIFLAAVVSTRRQSIIKLRTLFVGFLVFAGLTIFGVIRQAIEAPILLLSDPVTLLITQNEFVSPIQTLMYYVFKTRPLRLGWTYVSAPALLVPRAFWPEKPESLSLQFMRDAFGTTGLMGYAYTPVTEAVLNFGFVGPFIVYSILSILMVKLVKHAGLQPGFYFICFALVVDFNRSDVGGLFYSMVCIGAAYWFMGLVSRLRWTPRATRGSFPSPVSAP